MAVTFAVTNFQRDVTARRVHRGTLTATGTTTAGGDAVTPALFGLSTIDNLNLVNPSYNGTLAFAARYNRATGKIQFFGTNATPGAAVADPEVTAGTSVSTYAVEFEAVGR